MNSCPCRDLLSTRNLVESRLVSDAYAMMDAVIGALSRKCPCHNIAKGGRSKEAPPGKRVNAIEKTSPLKALPSSPHTDGETSGTASVAGPAAPPTSRTQTSIGGRPTRVPDSLPQ